MSQACAIVLIGGGIGAGAATVVVGAPYLLGAVGFSGSKPQLQRDGQGKFSVRTAVANTDRGTEWSDAGARWGLEAPCTYRPRIDN